MLRKLNKLIERMRKSHDESNYADCVSTAQTIIGQHPNSMSFYTKCQSYICSCQSKAKNTAEAIEACSDLLKKLPNDAETLYNRAQAYIVDEQLENGNLGRSGIYSALIMINMSIFVLKSPTRLSAGS